MGSGPRRGLMRKIDALKREAMESAQWRGHDMIAIRELTRFGQCKPTYATSHCRRCGMDIEINLRPLPQQMEITGQAVSQTCPKKESDMFTDVYA